MNTRVGKKWTISEVLQLQREVELLGWNYEKIAIKHKRTANGIMFKVEQEGFEKVLQELSEQELSEQELSEQELSEQELSEQE